MKDMMSGGLANLASTAQNTFSKVQSNIDKVTGKNKLLSASFDEITARIKQTEQTINSSKIPSQIREARRELEQLNKMRDTATRQTGGGGSSSGGGGFLGGLVRQALPVVGIAGALTFGSTSFQAALKNDASSSAINFATDGKGKKAINSVESINDKYGLDNAAGIEGFKTLAGSVRSLNLPLSETIRMYKSVGMASAAMKVDGEAQKGIYLAMGQIASKGTVSAEELRGQIGERLSGAFGIAAKAMGVSEQKLGEMMQKGELLSKDFLPRFATELEKTFGKEASSQVQSYTANYNRFNNLLRDITIWVGTKLLPVLISGMNTFISIAHWLKQNAEWFGLLAIVVGTAGLAYGAYYVWVNALSLAMMAQTAIVGGLTTAWKWLSVAMMANPIGFIIAGIAALVAGLVYAYYHFEKFRSVVDGLWESFKQVFTNIGTFFKQTFEPIFKAIDYFKKGEYASAALEVGKLVYNLSPVGMAVNATKFALQGGFTKDVVKKYNEGAIASIRKSQKAKLPEVATADGGGTSTNTSSVTNEELGKGITGSGPRVININGVKFAEKIEFHVANMQEGAEEALQTFENMFLRVLNSGAAIQ